MVAAVVAAAVAVAATVVAVAVVAAAVAAGSAEAVVVVAAGLRGRTGRASLQDRSPYRRTQGANPVPAERATINRGRLVATDTSSLHCSKCSPWCC